MQATKMCLIGISFILNGSLAIVHCFHLPLYLHLYNPPLPIHFLPNCCRVDHTTRLQISLICSLNHPNILGCMGVVTRNRKICLLTEYIPRGCLHNLIVEPIRYPLSWPTLVSFAKDIASGMVSLHIFSRAT